MSRKTALVAGSVLALSALLAGVSTRADEFTKADQERWEKEYQTVVKEGRELWTSPALGTNGVACAQCHPNAANTHPETYPKFQQQLGHRLRPSRARPATPRSTTWRARARGQ